MSIGFFLLRTATTFGLLSALLCGTATPTVAQGNVLKSLSGSARRQLRKGQYANLLPEVEQRLRYDSLNADLWALRAECHLNENTESHAAIALADLNKALRLQPNTWAYLADRGFANSQTFRHAESVADLSAALQQTPADASLLYLRGYGQFSTNHLSEAIADFTQASALAPREKDYAIWLAIAHMVAGRDSEAFRICNTLIQNHKDYSLAYGNRALVRLNLNDPVGARQDLGRVAPDSSTQLVSAVLYQKAGQAAEAQQLFDELQTQAKDKASFFFERGDVYLQLGDIPAAEADWKRAAQLGNREAATRLAAGFKPRP